MKKWKRLLKRKRLLSLFLLAIAILATVFVFRAIRHSTTQPTNGNSVHAFPTKTDSDESQQGYFGTLVGDASTTTWQTPKSAPISRLMIDLLKAETGLGYDNTDSGTSSDDNSASALLAEISGDNADPAINGNGDKVDQGSDYTDSDTFSDDSSTPILLVENVYPEYDRDLGMFPGRSAVGHDRGGHSDVSEEPSPSPVPEPTSMILLGTGLVTLAGFSRKKFKK